MTIYSLKRDCFKAKGMNTTQRTDMNKLTGSEGVRTVDYIGEGTLLMPGCHMTLAT